MIKSFNMIKFKFRGVRPEIDKLIKDVCLYLGLYDHNFSEEDQCSGYYSFKELCLMSEYPCSIEEFEEYKKKKGLWLGNTPPGFYLITKFHQNLRKNALEAIKEVRRIIKSGEADKVIVMKTN